MNFKKLCAAALAAIGVLTFVSCGNTDTAPNGDKCAEKGAELYAEGKYSEALASYLEAEISGIEDFGTAELYSSIGNCYYKRGEYDKCIEYQLRCLDADPEYFNGWVNLGVAYRKSGDRDKALKCYETALNYDPYNSSSIPLYISLGSLYIEFGKPISAIEYLETAQAVYPETPDIYAYLAIAYKMAFEYEKSEEALATAQELGYTRIAEIQEQLNKLN